MKVLLCSPLCGIRGGIARWTEHILNACANDSAIQINVLDMGRSDNVGFDSSLHSRAISGIRHYTGIIKEYRNKIKQGDYDIAHICSSASIGLFRDLIMIKAAQKRGIKTVIHFHFGRIPDLAKRNNWEWMLIRKVVRLADRAIVLDKMSLDTLKAHGFENVEELPNPLAPSVNAALPKDNLQKDESLILYAGHVLESKGIVELVEAVKQLNGFRLRLLGSITPEFKARLLSISNNEPWLEIAGEKPYDEVLPEMARCGIFALPSYSEGFPNVILESMAAGCAIVSSNVGAIPEMLEPDSNGQYAILVGPRDSYSLKTALEQMAQSETLKAECRRNVKCRVNERYGIDSVKNQLIDIWKK